MPDKWQIGEIRFQRCPKKLIDIKTQEYFRAFRRFEMGFLPNIGGWIDQPAKFNDILDIIENELAAIRQEEEAKNVKQRT